LIADPVPSDCRGASLNAPRICVRIPPPGRITDRELNLPIVASSMWATLGRSRSRHSSLALAFDRDDCFGRQTLGEAASPGKSQNHKHLRSGQSRQVASCILHLVKVSRCAREHQGDCSEESITIVETHGSSDGCRSAMSQNIRVSREASSTCGLRCYGS
jgi:hypothetical protein